MAYEDDFGQDELGMGAVAQGGQQYEPERLSIDDLVMQGPRAEEDMLLLQEEAEDPLAEMDAESGYESGAQEIGTWPTPELGADPLGQPGAPQGEEQGGQEQPRDGEQVALEIADTLRQKATERDAQSRAFQEQARQQGVEEGSFPGGWY